MRSLILNIMKTFFLKHLFWDKFAFRYFPTCFPLLHEHQSIRNRRDGAGIGDFFLQYFSVQNVQNVNVTIQCTLAIYSDFELCM